MRQRAGVPAIRASRRVIGGRCKRNKPVLRRSEAVAIAQALRRRGAPVVRSDEPHAVGLLPHSNRHWEFLMSP